MLLSHRSWQHTRGEEKEARRNPSLPPDESRPKYLYLRTDRRTQYRGGRYATDWNHSSNGGDVVAERLSIDPVWLAVGIGEAFLVTTAQTTCDLEILWLVMGKMIIDGVFERTVVWGNPQLFCANVERLKALHRHEGRRIAQFLSQMLEKNPRMATEYT